MSGSFGKWVLVALVLAAGFVFFWNMEERSPSQNPSTQVEREAAPQQRDGDKADTTDAAAESAQSVEQETGQKTGQETQQESGQSPAQPSEQAAAEGESAKPATEGSAAAETGDASVSEDIIKGTLNKGDTMTKLLEPHADAESVQNIVSATRQVFPMTSFRAGQPYVVVCDVQSGTVKRFEYEIDQKRRLVVEGLEAGSPMPVARVEMIEYDVQLALVESRIDDNLFQAVADIGESPQLALLIANLFGWEINFIRDLKEGDSFSILFEKLYREGEFRGYGRTLGATFTNKGKTYEAFLFYDSRGREHHYNIRGENLRKTLLQAPLSFTRVTSGYTKSRKHPIFGDHRAHFGVDYGAPMGTPVKAVGDGVVTLRGWAGGYGNQVVVRHTAGLESMYSHLSGFARGVAKGSRVRQGQVIAYVGSTGNSTGPHLDFRLKQNGNFINPTKAVNPRSESVSKANMAAFAQRMELVRAFMNGSRAVDTYDQEEAAVPAAVQAAVQAAAAKEIQKQDEQPKEKPARKKRRNRRSE